MQRRLAAIMAADVVGYSQLMSEDEARALGALAEMRGSLFEPVVAEQHGDIVKRMGDGWLVEFANVSDAIGCAINVQTGLSGHEQIRLRIGIHVGEVTSVEDDIFGNGVNVAARLETLADPGQVLISDTAFNSLDRKTADQFHGGEGQQLKNIARPVQVWRWPLGDAAGAAGPNSAEAAESVPSIAVLPFDNMSGDPEQEFFSDGITEDIITDLSKVSGLTVIARNSTFVYKGQAVDAREICKDLNVRYMLEGSVRRAGNRVRINAQLIEGESGAHLWADRFDGDLEDIFAVQDDITRQIVAALQVRLTLVEKDDRQAQRKVDPEAYECLMRGRTIIYEFDPDSFGAAWEEFERAAALDPGLAGVALAGLSAIRSTEYFNGWNGAGRAELEEAVDLANQAVEADSRAAFAQHALAIALLRSDQMEAAARAAERAMELDPNFAGASTILGGIRDLEGRHEEAVDLFDQSLRLDPEYHVATQLKGRSLLALGRIGDAEACFRDRIRRIPNTDLARMYLAAICGLTDRQNEAQKLWDEIAEVNPGFSFAHFQSMVSNKDLAWYRLLLDGLTKANLLR